MKKTLLFLVLAIGAMTIYSFNPFSGDDWKDVANKISGTFEKGIKFLGKTFKNAEDLTNEAFSKIKECTAVVGLGSQWAGQRVAYEAAQASLDVAQQSLTTAQASAQAFNVILGQLAQAAGKGVNIKKMSFEAYTSKLMTGQGPRVTFEATILGQDIKKDVTIDFSKPLDAAKSLAKDIIQELKAYKDLVKVSL